MYYKIKTNKDKSTEIFPPSSFNPLTVYMRTYNADRVKRSAKGSNFKEDDSALLVCIVYSFWGTLTNFHGFFNSVKIIFIVLLRLGSYLLAVSLFVWLMCESVFV